MGLLSLTEEDVKKVLTMEMAIEAVEAGLRKMAIEEAFSLPRSRCQTDQVMMHVLPAAAKSLGVIGYKAYTTTKQGARFHVTIFDGKTGEMVSTMKADWLGQVRTGAASAVATRLLARKNATKLGVYGSGKQARTQIIGVCKVRQIEKITLYSPNAENRRKLVEELSKEGYPIVAAEQPEQAARGQDIICTATTSKTPVLLGEWVDPGTHLNIIGSNFLGKTEIDLEVVRKSSTLVIDSKEQGRLEAGDFVEALEKKVIEWTDVFDIGRVMTGRGTGRTSETDITLFKSLGIGIEDIVVAWKVYQAALDKGVGRMLDIL